MGLASETWIERSLTGFGIYATVFFPQSMTMKIENASGKLRGRDFDQAFGFDMLVGFMINLYQGKKIRVPLTLGPHYVLTILNSSSVYKLGAGANVSFNYSFTDSFFAVLRVQAAYDFLGTSTFSIIPTLGVGITLD